MKIAVVLVANTCQLSNFFRTKDRKNTPRTFKSIHFVCTEFGCFLIHPLLGVGVRCESYFLPRKLIEVLIMIAP